MSQKLICDVCGKAINEPNTSHKVRIDHENTEKESADICEVCFTSPIILSEMRRTRTKKPQPKRGRPKGSKKPEVPPLKPAEEAPKAGAA